VVDYIITGVLSVLVIGLVASSTVNRLSASLSSWWDMVVTAARTGSYTTAVPSQATIAGVQTLLLLVGAVIVVYTSVFLGTWGATIGHRVAGIRVIKAPLPMSILQRTETAAFKVEKPGWMRAISKGLSWALFTTGGWLFWIVQVVNVFLPLAHRRHQSLTDMFANTLVIRTEDPNK
jgi:uncharacterized RDD family membrane protein YckC